MRTIQPAAIVTTIVLLVVTPRQSADFWLTLAAVLGLLAMHAVYWLVTHPVNNFWLQDKTLSRLGSGFFSLRSTSTHRTARPAEWTSLRDRREYSHVARAGLALLCFIAPVIAVTSGTS